VLVYNLLLSPLHFIFIKIIFYINITITDIVSITSDSKKPLYPIAMNIKVINTIEVITDDINYVLIEWLFFLISSLFYIFFVLYKMNDLVIIIIKHTKYKFTKSLFPKFSH